MKQYIREGDFGILLSTEIGNVRCISRKQAVKFAHHKKRKDRARYIKKKYANN